ncbi:disease resistance protein RGA2-like [Coffea eugenioides]|uniref:disease resistance protein RGA2-like n=1 Tax=Coffea eugenioides TaxID=49369 RepID=UPI000F60A2D4|nr:disease resistance protein RGA2-like [Coffea eugenioides]
MEAFVGILVDTLNSMIQKERGLLCGVATDMQKLSRLLSTIKAVLEDAEQKQFIEKAIQLWFKELNVVACEIDDVLDDYAAEASRVKYKKSGCLSFMCYPVAGNLVFRHRIGTRMKEILEKFNAIADERKDLGLSDQKRGTYFNASRETGSTVNEPEVLGRDEEKGQIVDILMKEKDRDDQNVSVLPIVGVGGLGKTTLAQLVFNDERIAKHFEPKLWVWVSGDFDGKRIIKALINSIQRTPTGELELAPLQRNLQELLRGKRYLIVLDDVWNEDPEEWEKLKSVLECGSKGSSIVTTTRMEKVATIMGTLETHRLLSLSDDQCWSLFRQRAFGRQEAEEYPNLVVIGKEIVNKCGGVPLAAKALGGFLQFKREETEWNFVKCSEIWNLPQDILPALRLSYLNLPVELRGCFAHCAVFPKGSKMKKEEVIRLWMANGLISSNGMKEVEDVGDAVLTELHYRSLFQAVKKDDFGSVLTFKMHDLVHDLAQSVMEAKHGGTESNRTMMLDLPNNRLTMAFPITITGIDQFSSFLSKYGSLRALIVRSPCVSKKFTLPPAEVLEFDSHAKWNWEADLPADVEYGRPEWQKRLPTNLHELYLHWDSERTIQRYNDVEVLEALKPPPNLQSLDIRGFKGSSSFPSWISTVTKVLVWESAAECIVGAQESTVTAAAMSPYSLKQLKLSRMPNLKGMLEREVQGTPGVFSQLQSLSFRDCPTLTLPLPRMPSLKELHIGQCPNMAWASISNLTSLNSLTISYTERLSCFPEEMLQNLSLLESLDLWHLHDIRALRRSLASLTALKKLTIKHSNKLEFLPQEASLQELHLVRIDKFVSLSMGTKALKSLTHLTLDWSYKTALPEEVKYFTALQKLVLEDFWNLTSLPDWFGDNLTSLQHLRLRNCLKLETLPSSIQKMTTLQSLTTTDCRLLEPRCERGGEEWHKIKHIPDLKIRYYN